MHTRNRRSVLLVDDEPDVLATIAMVLEGEGFEVQTVLDAYEALERIHAHSFDLIMTDIRMPGLDGVELLHKVKELDDTLQIIVMTGHTALEDPHDLMLEYGAAGFLNKPFDDLDQLLDMVDDALKKRDKALSQSENSQS